MFFFLKEGCRSGKIGRFEGRKDRGSGCLGRCMEGRDCPHSRTDRSDWRNSLRRRRSYCCGTERPCCSL